MKMNKKGFTLVELLAVIVILAIIALIATPIILGVIDDARKGAAKSSALGFVDAVEKSIALGMVSDTNTSIPASIETSDITKVKVKGDAPTSVSLSLDSAGSVTSGTITVSGYTVTFSNGKVSGTSKASASN